MCRVTRLSRGTYRRGDIDVSCTRPITAVRTDEFNEETGKFKYKILGTKYSPENHNPGEIGIPCGKCLGCRLDYSRQWANRMVMELDHCNNRAVFATLTYDQEHVPKVYDCDDNGELLDSVKSYSLLKKDVQDFMKRLRGRQKFEDREIRFYLSGEYGSHTLRPHYHAILFNVGLSDFPDLQPFRINELKQQTYISEEFADIWENGFIVLSEVSYETMAYVSRYVSKKANANNELLYEKLGVLPEFSLMSLKPGIGSYFYEDHPELFDKDFYYVNDGHKRIKIPITKNLLNSLAKIDPERYDRIKASHKLFADDKILSQLHQTDLNSFEYYDVLEQKQLSKANSLRRNKV